MTSCSTSRAAKKRSPSCALDDALAESPYADDVLESRFARFTKDGKIYGAPHDVHPLVMLYHDVAWQEAGVDLSQVETWNDFLDACGKVDLKMADGRDRYPDHGRQERHQPAGAHDAEGHLVDR